VQIRNRAASRVRPHTGLSVTASGAPHGASRSGRDLRPRSGSSAKSLLLTVLGEFVLPASGSVWTSTVVRTMAALGVEERNARQAAFRLVERGYVHSEKEGRRARLHLTTSGRRLLGDGSRRIYEFGAYDDTWDGRWVVVVCFIPEEQRTKRHQLRSQLGFAGFGFIAPGVAVSPHLSSESAASSILEGLGLLPGAVVLRAETGALVEPAELLDRSWDLAGLASEYEEFVKVFVRRTPRTDEACFVALVELVHAWRRFPFIDPEIPSRLLPPRWPGRRAKGLFDDLHGEWSAAAASWYHHLESSASSEPALAAPFNG
jgi:phenylacetic acid degradation operon negative regulatory protein